MLLPLLLNLPQFSVANTSLKVRVHNALVDLVTAGPYYRVTFEGRQANLIVDTATTPAAPASVVVNEINSNFDVDRKYGRSYRRERTTWTWLALVKFDCEVTTFEAVEAWNDSPLILPKTALINRQATLELAQVTHSHPTRHGGHSGTLAEFTFEARLSRR